MENPRHWRLNAQRYRLEGSLCPACGQVTFPPRPCCLATFAAAAPENTSLQDALPFRTAPRSLALAGYSPEPQYRLSERITG